MKKNKILNSAIMEIIDNQIDDNDPPETKQTLDRLISEGYTEKEARNLIGIVVSSEIFEVLKQGRPFDQKKFVTSLNALPNTGLEV